MNKKARILILISLIVSLSLFGQSEQKSTVKEKQIEKVVITYNKEETNNLEFLDKVNIREKRFIYNKSLKEETLERFKKTTLRKGGNIVYIPEPRGFGIFVSHSITGYIYKTTN